MRRLVGDLLLLARADAGHAPLREPLDLADVVIEAASELEPGEPRPRARRSTCSRRRSLGSRDDLQRVATNLIENALRHTPPGTHVTASTRTLPDGGAELVVADDGPGIAPELRDDAVRALRPRRRRPRRLLRPRPGDRRRGHQAHGGTVTVDESPHGGARFTVRLPPAAADRRGAGRARPSGRQRA